MKKYLFLFVSIICFYQSYSQIDTDTILLTNSNLFLRKTSLDRYFFIDRGDMLNPKYEHIYLTEDGKITCKIVANHPTRYDSLYETIYEPNSGRVLTKTTIYINRNDMFDKSNYNASKIYYNDNGIITKIEQAIIILQTKQATNFKLVEEKENIYNKKGKIIGQNPIMVNKLFRYMYLTPDIIETRLDFFVNKDWDTIIRNGSGYYSDINYQLSFYDMSYEDTFFVKGNILNGLQNGEWEAKRKYGTTYFIEQYEDGKLLSGMSYDEEGQSYNYNIVLKNCMYGTCEKDLMDFVRKNVTYPEVERVNEIQGRTYTKFIVDKDGIIKDVTNLTSISSGLENEAVRVVKLMKQWSPSILRGQSKAMQFILPVNFIME